MPFESLFKIFFGHHPRQQIKCIKQIAFARGIRPENNSKLFEMNIYLFQRLVIFYLDAAYHLSRLELLHTYPATLVFALSRVQMVVECRLIGQATMLGFSVESNYVGCVSLDIKSQTKDELEAQFKAWNEPAYRVAQVLEWLYVHRVTDWDAMTNLPKALRDQLRQHYSLRLSNWSASKAPATPRKNSSGG